LDTPYPDSFQRDARLIGLVSIAHLLSHFFQLALPPLFPLLRVEFAVSYAALGALVGVFYVASGVAQFTAGFVVDRLGARPVLLGGIGLMASGAVLASFVPGLHGLYPVALLMGIGNGAFHPANFSILNANVAPHRLGYAYSSHGIGGNLGYAAAPLVSFALGTAFGWRAAMAWMGCAGLLVWAGFVGQRVMLSSRRTEAGAHHTLQGSLALFRQLPILFCFAFFCVLTLATVGLQTFLPTALNAAFAMPLALATSAVTAYLLGGTAGILLGGYLATRFARHDRVAGVGVGIAAAIVALIPVYAWPAGLLLPMLAAVGIALGSTGPSRDLIVRQATPAGASGRVYGFVYSGLDLGATIGPVVIGFMLDRGAARGVFLVIAALLALAIGTVIGASRASRPA
jgi:FSR family fosmidomycin resistance protein-like MFS transporter